VNVGEFVSALSSNGLARNNTWECTIFPPSSITGSLQSLYGALNSVNAASGFAEINADRGSFLSGQNAPDDGTRNRNVNNSTLINMNNSISGLRLYATSCSLPSRDMKNIEFREYGEPRSGAFLSTHKDAIISFYCSEDLREKLFFELWQDSIFNPNNKQQSYYDEYARNASIVIDKYSTGWKKVTASYQLFEAYPTNIGALPLTFDGADVLRLDITFKYRNYKRIL
jgi:hypothetical protein